jgi:nucleoid DNA-binding protein
MRIRKSVLTGLILQLTACFVRFGAIFYPLGLLECVQYSINIALIHKLYFHPKTTEVVTMAAPKAKKPAPKKAPAKEAVKKVAKKADVKPAKALAGVKERFSKAELLANISETTSLSKKDVSAVIDALTQVIEAHIGKKGCGEFVLPGLMKIATIKKPAKKARKGINPFNGEETTFKAKPASIAVKIRPLKKLKAMVE